MVMKKLKEDVYAMGTMEIVDVREMNKKCKSIVQLLVAVDPSEHFTGYGLGKRCFLVQSIHVLRRGTVILSSTTKDCFGLV